MANLYKMLRDLLPAAPLQVGEVTDSSGGVSTVSLLGGGALVARGAATIGSKVYVRDGVIEGAAPDLDVVDIEV